jgi:hypothetical protein
MPAQPNPWFSLAQAWEAANKKREEDRKVAATLAVQQQQEAERLELLRRQTEALEALARQGVQQQQPSASSSQPVAPAFTWNAQSAPAPLVAPTPRSTVTDIYKDEAPSPVPPTTKGILNGNGWKVMTQEQRLLYLRAAADGIIQMARALSLPPETRLPLGSIGEIARRLDRFYSTSENVTVPIPGALALLAKKNQ